MMLSKSIITGFTCIALLGLSSCASDLTDTTSAVSKSTPSKSPDGFLPPVASPKVISKSAKLAKDKHGMPTYKSLSDRTRYVRTTAFSHMENEPGAPGRLNASGTVLKYGKVRSAAADWSVYPLGTVFRVKGLPHTYVVDDYGSALVGINTIDIFKPSLSLMRKWGTRKTEITVIQWGSFQRSLNLLKGRKKYPHCYKMYIGCKKQLGNSYASN